MSLDGLPHTHPDVSSHLAMHKYIFVCTLTVAAWDTLVLSRRTWKHLVKVSEQSALKAIAYFMRTFMILEFTVIGVGFFDATLSPINCKRFFLVQPICTTILLGAASAVSVIRIHAIYHHNRTVLIGLGSLFAVQVIVMAIFCGFYQVVPLPDGQGCISGPKATWVGIYWVAPTLFYTASTILAVMRSVKSLKQQALNPWFLMLRDSLNLYVVIWLVNIINIVFWFTLEPTDDADPIKTILTSLAAVLTASNTVRIVLNIHGSLIHGGSFDPMAPPRQTSKLSHSHILSARAGPSNLHSMLTVNGIPEKSNRDMALISELAREPEDGVKVTIDREIGYDTFTK